MDTSGASPPTKFVSQAEVTDLLNVALATEVWDLLLQFVGENYCRSPQPFTLMTVGGTFVYSVPQNMRSIVSVDLWLGGQYPVSARRYSEDMRNALRGYPLGWNAAYPAFYELQGFGSNQSIVFRPTPNLGFQVDINYIQNCPVLSNLTDIWDDVNGWSELAVLDAAAKLCVKDGQLDVAQYLGAQKERMIQKIRAAGPNRHAGEPERVQIIENRMEWGSGWVDG